MKSFWEIRKKDLNSLESTQGFNFELPIWDLHTKREQYLSSCIINPWILTNYDSNVGLAVHVQCE